MDEVRVDIELAWGNICVLIAAPVQQSKGIARCNRLAQLSAEESSLKRCPPMALTPMYRYGDPVEQQS